MNTIDKISRVIRREFGDGAVLEVPPLFNQCDYCVHFEKVLCFRYSSNASKKSVISAISENGSLMIFRQRGKNEHLPVDDTEVFAVGYLEVFHVSNSVIEVHCFGNGRKWSRHFALR